jgi:tetratricopeptide (TPR) repeat protein
MPTIPGRARALIALGLGLAFLLATLFLVSGEPTLITRGVEEDTEVDADRWYNGGVNAFADGDYDQAIVRLSKAMQIYAKLISSTWDELMAEVWRPLKKKYGRISLPKTDWLIKEAFRYRAKFDQAITLRGDAYSKQGQFQEAIADYSEAIRLEEDANRYRHRAAAYRAIGETAKAESDERAADFLNKPKEPVKP